jgi:DinB superfamily
MFSMSNEIESVALDAKERKSNGNRRAELLAERIEQGAAELAAFAAGLSDAEWNTLVSQTDRRTVGIIIHHVASIYPVEMGVVRAIVDGNPVADVTWDVVAKLNADHARENSSPNKAETLELLRRNSADAAAATRALTDADLDRASPLGLSYGAPMTAQFVIEDHALRHSWHHLARIRKALGRS